MPKKTLNTDIVNDYLDHIKKDKEKNLSIQTLKTYENIGNNLPFNILTNQNTIIKKLKDVYENPNTLALYLNMIILVRKYKDEEVDKLIKFRNQLRDKIIASRKSNLDKLDDELPNLDFDGFYDINNLEVTLPTNTQLIDFFLGGSDSFVNVVQSNTVGCDLTKLEWSLSFNLG